MKSFLANNSYLELLLQINIERSVRRGMSVHLDFRDMSVHPLIQQYFITGEVDSHEAL